jgi:hypothetical protein
MLFVLGDSHTAALRNGFAAFSASDQAAIHDLYGGIKFGQIETAAKLRRKFYAFSKDEVRLRGRAGKMFQAMADRACIEQNDPNFFAFSAGFHSATAIAAMANAFTIDPAVGNKSYLSEAAFHAIVTQANQPLMNFYLRLRKLDIRFIVLGSPPVPLTQVARYGMAPEDAPQLATMIERAKAVIAEQLSAAGVRYVLPPEEVAQDGFLRRELCGDSRPNDDHGNGAYGEIFLRHLFFTVSPVDFDEVHAVPPIRQNAANNLG